MMRKLMNLVVSVLVFFLVSCSSEQVQKGTEAENLFQEIKSNYKSKRYLLSLEKISTFRSKFPYSFYVTEVELLRADIYFEQENYLEAVDAYLSFRDFHPKYKRLDKIEWRIAESFFHQLPDTVDRDITPAKSAINSYKDILRKFPSSEYAAKAGERIVMLERMLEEKELYIADFYFRTHDYISASYRYKRILENAKDINILKKSIKNLVQSHIKLKQKEKCIRDISTLGQFLEDKIKVEYEEKCTEIKQGKV